MRRVLPLLLLLVADPANAQGVPACVPARSGQLACIAGRLCACRFERGGSVAARPDRWAWDCGILRPDCQVPPAEAPEPAPMPGLIVVPQVTLPGPRPR